MIKPHDLYRLKEPFGGERIVEIISYRFPIDQVMIRLEPKDPTSLIQEDVKALKSLTKEPIWMHRATFTYDERLPFPRDMLRYDRCQIDPRLRYEVKPTGEIRIVQITNKPKPKWSIDRWLSFDAVLRVGNSERIK